MSHGGFECGHGGWRPVKEINSNKVLCGIDFLSIKCHDLLLKVIHNCNKELYNVICDESPYSKAKIGITTKPNEGEGNSMTPTLVKTRLLAPEQIMEINISEQLDAF